LETEAKGATISELITQYVLYSGPVKLKRFRLVDKIMVRKPRMEHVQALMASHAKNGWFPTAQRFMCVELSPEEAALLRMRGRGRYYGTSYDHVDDTGDEILLGVVDGVHRTLMLRSVVFRQLEMAVVQLSMESSFDTLVLEQDTPIDLMKAYSMVPAPPTTHPPTPTPLSHI
jgi:hypothetical protein